MNKQSRPINSREYEKYLYINPNTRVPARLVGNTGTRENTSGIKKVQTYKNLITAKTRTSQETQSEENQGIKMKER